MAENPPYMNAYGLIAKILDKIKQAPTPDRFTQDFLGTKLGFTSGSARAFIPFAKRIGLLGSDGTPTDLYKSFRNPTQSGLAMAKALKTGYGELYARNEYVHDLDTKQLEGLAMEVTGLEKGSSNLKGIVGSFNALKALSKFDGKLEVVSMSNVASETATPNETPAHESVGGFNIAYTFNLNLPETTNIAVFNAIFKSLRDNMLVK